MSGKWRGSYLVVDDVGDSGRSQREENGNLHGQLIYCGCERGNCVLYARSSNMEEAKSGVYEAGGLAKPGCVPERWP